MNNYTPAQLFAILIRVFAIEILWNALLDFTYFPSLWMTSDIAHSHPPTFWSSVDNLRLYAVFQIKRNPAEVGTSESTNLGISTFETDSADATATFQKMVAKYGAEASARAKHGAWQLISRQAPQ